MNSIKHWTITRLTSLPLIPLFIYFIGQSEYIITKSRMELISWVKEPVVTGTLLAFIICAFWHARLGMEEIIIDYVSSEKTQAMSLRLNKVFFLVLGAACLYAVLAISFGKF